MSVLKHHNYRSFLKNTLAGRTRSNPAYSLRALARQLGMAPSYLSAVLSGKKNLSPEKALSIASKLSLGKNEKEYFCLLVQVESTSDPALKESFLQRAHAHNPSVNAQDLSLDHFKVISDWHHFAMLAATELPKTETSATGFSRALGVSRIEAELALERMERLEMIEKDRSGRYVKTQGNPRVVSHAPNVALRKYHRQTLQKAIESLETQTAKEKIVGSETIAIDSSQVEGFRELSERFFSDVLRLAKKSKKKDHVYHLGVQFFRLTEIKK